MATSSPGSWLKAAACWLALAALAPFAAAQAPPLVYFAGQAGRLTLERDRAGGNPFATALIEVLKMPGLSLHDFGRRLAVANSMYSYGWQNAELPKRLPDVNWSFDQREGEHRVALIIAVSDYSSAVDGYVPSLAGSRFDAERLASAFTAAGFLTTTLLDTPRSQLDSALNAFEKTSAEAEVAMVYITGHGVQRGRTPFLILGDYPSFNPDWLGDHALSLDRIAGVAKASKLNLVFFSSCRSPFRKLEP